MTNVPNRVPWVNVVVGILVIVSPFATAAAMAPARTSLIVTGIIIAAAAIVEIAMYPRSRTMSYVPAINIVAGLWLLFSRNMAGDMATAWSNVALGICAIATAIISLQYERIHSHTPATHI